jgi:hypothetical protein
MQPLTLIVAFVAAGACSARSDEAAPRAPADCILSSPSGAPTRFLECAEHVLAIVTPGSHCVPGAWAEVGDVECADGTALQLGGDDESVSCRLHRGSWDHELPTPCVIR